MNFLELVLLSCALAMDAFAVSLCKGFSVKTLTLRHYLLVGIYFGGFQALMPALGFLIGVSFAFLQVSLTLALFLIASITFIFCIIALKIGNCFGTHLKGKAELECANFAWL